MRITHIGTIDRIYFDANGWDSVADHPDRDALIHNLTGTGKRSIFPSIVNIIELLRAPEDRRRVLAAVVQAAANPDHAILGDPMYLHEVAAKDFAAGNKSTTVSEDDFTQKLRTLVFDPSSLTSEEKSGLTAGVHEMKKSYENWWKMVSADRAKRDPGFRVDVGFLDVEAIDILQEYDVSKNLGLSRTEITELLKGTADLPPSPIWVAFAFQIGMALELVNRNLHSNKKAKELPNWMDMSQLTYLGLVTDFVTSDVEFLEAAVRVADLVTSATEYRVAAVRAPAFLARRGFPI